MKLALPLRALVALLFVGLASLTLANTEKPAAGGPAPVPYAKKARFSKQYDPNLKPDHEAYPVRLAPLVYPAKFRFDITQPAPSRTARVSSMAGSEPTPGAGSVMAKQERTSPRASGT